MAQDLTYGEDERGDNALFIEEKHFIDDGWKLSKKAKSFLSDRKDALFFRVIRNGEEQRGHGWIEKGEVIQWG
jgi:hypothetical protein